MIMMSVAALITLVLCLLFGVPYLDFMKKKMYGQYIREEVQMLHAKKNKTPTTGGVFLVAALLVGSLIALFMAQALSTRALIVLMTLVFYTFTGFEDDIKKIKGCQNEGLSPRAKLTLQIAVSMLPAVYLVYQGQTEISIFNLSVDLMYLYPFFAVFMIVGSSNALNLTDGLDGLASGCAFFAFLACALISYFNGYTDIAIISIAASAACLGFFYFNKNPARIFMGDTGSLALGGLLATIAIMGKFELWLIPIGIVFIAETLSVMLQVASFKTTGKRIFKMSPIHHHFELSGWSEKKIVLVFSMISALGGILAVWGFSVGKALCSAG
ncbi:MAG: phospho-N-acetylmuramoyl-pentapeptide-transferase [Candidatus Gastranaerophilales bacterium]|nr:phospho-N-acetylmuramoyl-pentapeptide-transferase [Candidatus Gastranaerophilales bacterium]